MSNPTKTQISEVMRHLSKRGASKGGHARAKALTSEERSAIASRAGKASGLARRKLVDTN